MFYFSICLLVWLFIGFIGGLRTILDRNFEEMDGEVFEEHLSNYIERPKQPKLFVLCLYTLTGPYWVKSCLKNKEE